MPSQSSKSSESSQSSQSSESSKSSQSSKLSKSSQSSKGLRVDDEGVARCFWCGDDPGYIDYHDHEWGRPVADDRTLFEKLCLEGFQAGLSWLTVLRKRPRFRQQFANFEPAKVARFNRRSVERLLRDPGIIRHRGKIESAIANAKHTLAIQAEFGSLAAYLWRFEPKAKDRPRRMTVRALKQLTQTPASKALSSDLRRRGFSFVGPTTMYALMQAMGLVNDHIEGCHVRAAVDRDRQQFARP